MSETHPLNTLKALEKSTKPKLVEEAHKYPEIVGAHGLSKEQLVEALTKAKKESGEWVEEAVEKKPGRKVVRKRVDKAALKKQLKQQKEQRDKAFGSGDVEGYRKARARYNRLKGKLRRFRKVEA